MTSPNNLNKENQDKSWQDINHQLQKFLFNWKGMRNTLIFFFNFSWDFHYTSKICAKMHKGDQKSMKTALPFPS